MKTVVETFIYQVPDEHVTNYVTIEDYIEFVNSMTCSFYDGDDRYVPEDINISRTFAKLNNYE